MADGSGHPAWLRHPRGSPKSSRSAGRAGSKPADAPCSMRALAEPTRVPSCESQAPGDRECEL